MKISIIDYVNQAASSAVLGNLSEYVIDISEPSPMDHFCSSLVQILKIGTNVSLDENNSLGRLLLIGLVSASENYIRSMISGTINFCPISQSAASEKSVNLGAVLWHTGYSYSRGALEHNSLAEEKGLKKPYLSIWELRCQSLNCRGS